MERKQQEELDAEARQRREALRRRKRLHDLPSRDFSAGTALMASPAAESPNAHALLAEIERYEKKLQNCHAELRHRQIEYLYVLNGGEPLDDTVYEDFDSDEEREDRSGVIENGEFRQLLELLAPQVTNNSVLFNLLQMDTNGSGDIDMHEFTDFIAKLQFTSGLQGAVTFVEEREKLAAAEQKEKALKEAMSIERQRSLAHKARNAAILEAEYANMQEEVRRSVLVSAEEQQRRHIEELVLALQAVAFREIFARRNMYVGESNEYSVLRDVAFSSLNWIDLPSKPHVAGHRTKRWGSPTALPKRPSHFAVDALETELFSTSPSRDGSPVSVSPQSVSPVSRIRRIHEATAPSTTSSVNNSVARSTLILKDMKSWQMSISTPELNMLLRAMIVADDPGAASLKRDFLHGKLPNRATWPLLVRASRTVEEMEIPLAYLRNKRTLRIGVKPLALFHAICAACARDGRKKAVDWATKALTAVQKRGILGPAEYLALCDVAASARHWKVVHQTLAALSEGFDARLSPSIVVRIVQLRLDAILFNASQSKEYISRVDTYAWVTAATLFWKRNVSFASEKGWLLMMKVYDTADERASAIRLFDNARRMKKDSPKLHAAFSAAHTSTVGSPSTPSQRREYADSINDTFAAKQQELKNVIDRLEYAIPGGEINTAATGSSRPSAEGVKKMMLKHRFSLSAVGALLCALLGYLLVGDTFTPAESPEHSWLSMFSSKDAYIGNSGDGWWNAALDTVSPSWLFELYGQGKAEAHMNSWWTSLSQAVGLSSPTTGAAEDSWWAPIYNALG
eukprot:gene10144-15597_t